MKHLLQRRLLPVFLCMMLALGLTACGGKDAQPVETEIGGTAGALSGILERLAAHQVFIEYMYAFAQGEKAHIVIRPSDLGECLKWLSEEECDILEGRQL